MRRSRNGSAEGIRCADSIPWGAEQWARIFESSRRAQNLDAGAGVPRPSRLRRQYSSQLTVLEPAINLILIALADVCLVGRRG